MVVLEYVWLDCRRNPPTWIYQMENIDQWFICDFYLEEFDGNHIKGLGLAHTRQTLYQVSYTLQFVFGSWQVKF